VGALLVTIDLGGVVFSLIARSHAVTRGATGRFALAGFVFVERHSRSPMPLFDLFRSGNFTGANLLTFFLYMRRLLECSFSCLSEEDVSISDAATLPLDPGVYDHLQTEKVYERELLICRLQNGTHCEWN